MVKKWRAKLVALPLHHTLNVQECDLGSLVAELSEPSTSEFQPTGDIDVSSASAW